MKSCQREDNIEKSKEDFIENQYLRGGISGKGGGGCNTLLLFI